MSKLVLEIGVVDNFLFGRVIDMPEEFRQKSDIIDVTTEDGSMKLYLSSCCGYPSISPTSTVKGTCFTLYLRGRNRDDDDRWFYTQCSSKNEAAELRNLIKRAVSKFNQKPCISEGMYSLEVVE